MVNVTKSPKSKLWILELKLISLDDYAVMINTDGSHYFINSAV